MDESCDFERIAWALVELRKPSADPVNFTNSSMYLDATYLAVSESVKKLGLFTVSLTGEISVGCFGWIASGS